MRLHLSFSLVPIALHALDLVPVVSCLIIVMSGAPPSRPECASNNLNPAARRTKQTPRKRIPKSALVMPAPKRNCPASATTATATSNELGSNDVGLGRQTRSHTPTAATNYLIRPLTIADVSSVYHLGLDIFTARDYPSLYRTWDEFAVLEYASGSRDTCFVAEEVAAGEDEGHAGENEHEHEHEHEHEQGAVAGGGEEAGGQRRSTNHQRNRTSGNRKLAGFLLGETITKSDSIGTRGYIEWVAIREKDRRRRLATRLLARFEQSVGRSGASVLLADTPADNAVALSLLAKAGLYYRTNHVYMSQKLEQEDGEREDVASKFEPDGGSSFDFHYTVKKKSGRPSSAVGGEKKESVRVNIRNMSIDDLYPVLRIGQEIFTHRNPNLYNFWEADTVLLAYQSDPDLCAVATVRDGRTGQDQVVAFAIGTTIEKPRSSWKYGYLVWLGCDPAYQGLGLAKQLYHTLIEAFARENVRMIMVDTQSSNEAALKFFRKLGFDEDKDEDHVYLCNKPSTFFDKSESLDLPLP